MTIEDLSSWLDAYGQAWEGRDADAAASLFTDEATYQWGPFEEPLRGRDAIRERWASAVAAQAEISFGYEPLAVSEGRGFVRWWVSFLVPAARQRVRLEGIFQVALDDGGSCQEFREWWNAEEEPLPGVTLVGRRRLPRVVALRRAYRRCVRNVSACSGYRQQQSADLQALCPSPLTDSNRRPPPYHGGALPTELRGRSPECSPTSGGSAPTPAVRRVPSAATAGGRRRHRGRWRSPPLPTRLGRRRP